MRALILVMAATACLVACKPDTPTVNPLADQKKALDSAKHLSSDLQKDAAEEAKKIEAATGGAAASDSASH